MHFLTNCTVQGLDCVIVCVGLWPLTLNHTFGFKLYVEQLVLHQGGGLAYKQNSPGGVSWRGPQHGYRGLFHNMNNSQKKAVMKMLVTFKDKNT